MAGSGRAADDYADYRLFRLLTLGSARLLVACLFLIVWNLAFYFHRETIVFLGSTAGLSLAVSLVAGTVAYTLYRRRGGRIEKTPPPFLR